MDKNKLIIIGAGAAGLVGAIVAAENGLDVTIIEKNDKVGKKILATGNGKCNITNSYIDETSYRSEDEFFAYKVIQRFGYKNTIDFFEKIGIYLVNFDGYYYPASLQASTVVDGLKYKLDSLPIKLATNEEVVSVNRKNGFFNVNTKNTNFKGDYLLVTTGGCSQPKLGSDGIGYKLAKSFGHSIIKPLPALCALKSNSSFFKKVKGIRNNSVVSIYINDEFYVSNSGELQLTDYGISGVLIFQISRYVSKALNSNKKVDAKIDFLPNYSIDEILDMLIGVDNNCPYKTILQAFEGFINRKLVLSVLQYSNIDIEKRVNAFSKKELVHIIYNLKNFNVPVCGTNSFDQSQVTCGGVNTKEINVDTLESKVCSNLYFAGEVLDVDGTCGGYNLQWAWATGYIAANSIKGAKNDTN